MKLNDAHKSPVLRKECHSDTMTLVKSLQAIYDLHCAVSYQIHLRFNLTHFSIILSIIYDIFCVPFLEFVNVFDNMRLMFEANSIII